MDLSVLWETEHLTQIRSGYARNVRLSRFGPSILDIEVSWIFWVSFLLLPCKIRAARVEMPFLNSKCSLQNELIFIWITTFSAGQGRS